MNHPKPEEWVPYVYGETAGTVRAGLKEHLRDCSQCREEVEGWQRSLKALDAWKLTRVRKARPGVFLPLFRFAAAAALVLFVGIVVGRATAPRVDLEKLRSAIAPQIRQELSSQMAELAHQEALMAASVTLSSGRHYTDQVAQQLYGALVAVKKDVDTVAVNADLGLRNTAQQLVELADYHDPRAENVPNP